MFKYGTDFNARIYFSSTNNRFICSCMLSSHTHAELPYQMPTSRCTFIIKWFPWHAITKTRSSQIIKWQIARNVRENKLSSPPTLPFGRTDGGMLWLEHGGDPSALGVNSGGVTMDQLELRRLSPLLSSDAGSTCCLSHLDAGRNATFRHINFVRTRAPTTMHFTPDTGCMEMVPC